MNFNKYLFIVLSSVFFITIYILYISPVTDMIDRKNKVFFKIDNTNFKEEKTLTHKNDETDIKIQKKKNNKNGKVSLYFVFGNMSHFKTDDILFLKDTYLSQHRFGMILTPYTKLDNEEDFFKNVDIILNIPIKNDKEKSIAHKPIALSSSLSLEKNMENFSKAIIQFKKIDALFFSKDAETMLSETIWGMIANVCVSNGYKIIIEGFSHYAKNIKDIFYQKKINVIEPQLILGVDSQNTYKTLDTLFNNNKINLQQNLFIAVQDPSLVYIIGEWMKKNETNFNYVSIINNE